MAVHLAAFEQEEIIMKSRRRVVTIIGICLFMASIGVGGPGPVGIAQADDGAMERRTVSRTPNMESEHSQLSMMQFYVEATRASGTLVSQDENNPTANGELEYWLDDPLVVDVNQGEKDNLLFTRKYAKPLVTTFWDEAESEDQAYNIITGDEVGLDIRRDAWASISLDDGETWKETNLSESALETSFDLKNGQPFPGDVTDAVHAVAGNKILVAWASKYCAQGSPRYSLKDLNGDGIPDRNVEGDDAALPMYPDPFGVSGNQRSIDYTDWMHHGSYPFAHIGEVPFSCIWTARGTVEKVMNSNGTPDDPSDDQLVWGVRWRKAERLTSGRRDAFKLAIDGVEDAGFSVVWQEDPEGLRPGYGEGPGVGWSGATVNHKADLWYSFITWDDFDGMEALDGTKTLDPTLLDSNKPKVFERMSMPVRLTDNEKCDMQLDQEGKPIPTRSEDGKITRPYCYDLDQRSTRYEAGAWAIGGPDGIGDLCPVKKNQDGSYTVVDYNRLVDFTNAQGKQMKICVTDDGRMLNGQTGSSRGRMALEGYTRPDGTKSAWAALVYEESKGLGEGEEVDPVTGEKIPALDIGKDAMFQSFEMSRPDLIAAGHMLNPPEIDPAIGTYLPLLPNDLSVARANGDRTAAVPNQYNSAIGRRGNLMTQPGYKMAPGKTSAIVLYKSGAERQGGPADIFMRRFVLPANFNAAVDNPFSVKYLDCNLWDTSLTDIPDATYARTAYPNGLCVSRPANLSSVTPTAFEELGNDADGTVPEHGITDRVLTWVQTPANLADEDWTNYYDVAKGHRGFVDGDFVMVMYAWSPNWLATSKGHEPYNLYIRRSFDGGLTWTTTPASSPWGGDGTSYSQTFGVGDRIWTVTRNLAAGDFEPARNVSQLTSSHETVLDPRYSPTNLGTQNEVNRLLGSYGTYTFFQYADDVRDPSKFFAVYETGDATVVLTAGEADPWDLYASRAINYGDDWDNESVYANGTGLWEERWDWVENKDETMAGESSIAGSPGGQFAWIVWNQWIQDEQGVVTEADPVFRRLYWSDNAAPVAEAGEYTAPAGTQLLLTATATDADNDLLTYTWDLDSDGIFETDGISAALLATGAPQAVAVRVCDSKRACDIDQGWINARRDAPWVWQVAGPTAPVQAGNSVTASARFINPGRDDSACTAQWDWGDGSVTDGETNIEKKGRSSVSGSHTYQVPGVYTVKALVNCGGETGWNAYQYAVVFDPEAGFVSGGGWIDSPAGALAADETMSGKVNFGFISKYHKGAVNPEGKAEFNFSAGGVNFASDNYEWLVIAGSNGYCRGTGKINGTGTYRFLVVASDGAVDGMQGADTFRIKIWDGSTDSGRVVYDNQPGSPDDALPVQPLSGGSIVVHSMVNSGK